MEAIRAIYVINELPRPRRRKVYKKRADPMEDLPDMEFRQRYRFGKGTIQYIVELVREDLAKDRRGAGLTPELQVLTAIRCWGRKEVTCDADLKICDVVARWRGSTHDARIFNECRLKERFEAGEFGGKRLLGDSGYKLEPYLFTPILRPQSLSEERYNQAHIATRNPVERCFGVWKSRFRCLLQGMTVKLQNVKTTVIALAVLHNIAIEHNDDLLDEELVFRDRWGGLTLFNVRNFTTRLLMNNSTFRELNAVDFKVSADLKFVLLVSDVRAGWRHARLARYHVYDVINRNKIPVSPVEDDRTAPLLQYAEWSPTGSSLVFVHDNDIFYKPRVLKTLVCRITNNGVPGVIFNGVPDFLYETQVLRLERALWFSPDAQTLLYVSYNSSLVHQHQYPWYGLEEQEPPAYPAIRTLRYPKVNTNNPVATVYVVSLKTPKFLFPHAIQFTPQIDKDWYVRWTAWTSERQLAVLLLNRAQNVSVISVCSATNYNCQDIIRDEADGSRWSGLGAEPEPECGWCGGSALLGGRTALFTSAPVADRGGAWRHAVRVGPDGKTSVTQGPFEITQLMGWDEGRKLLYLMGTAPEKAGERHLYRVLITDDGTWPAPHCLTCLDSAPLPPDEPPPPTSEEPPLQEMENTTSPLPAWPTSTVLPHVAEENDSLPTECLYNRVIFSRNFSYYVQECLGPGPPTMFLCASNGERRAVLWDGAPLRQKFAALAVPQAKVFRVEVQANREARVRLYLPPGFRETDDLPLPLVLHVSAEPGGQLVTEQWNPGWGWYLAAARNFIVAEIDARGSGGQGEELRTEIYHKLLSVDVEDQIAVLTYLRDNLKMVDGSRVGVWGRGYGAGAAAALVADDARNVTRCLAAVAPVTDLRHYNSFWTERYTGYGAHWAGALSASAVWRSAGNLPPRRLLLAHATADLAAPPDHALKLARALIRAGALYTHQIYPDEGHNFERSTIHLHKTMEQFFDECFGPVEVADWDTGGVGGLFPFREDYYSGGP